MHNKEGAARRGGGQGIACTHKPVCERALIPTDQSQLLCCTADHDRSISWVIRLHTALLRIKSNKDYGLI